MFTSFFTNTLLCSNLVRLTIEPKLGFELGLVVKQMNINKSFPKLALSYL